MLGLTRAELRDDLVIGQHYRLVNGYARHMFKTYRVYRSDFTGKLRFTEVKEDGFNFSASTFLANADRSEIIDGTELRFERIPDPIRFTPTEPFTGDF